MRCWRSIAGRRPAAGDWETAIEREGEVRTKALQEQAVRELGDKQEKLEKQIVRDRANHNKTANRAIKRGRRAAEDALDDAEYQAKQHPLATACISFSIGLGLGAVISMLLARNRVPGD